MTSRLLADAAEAVRRAQDEAEAATARAAEFEREHGAAAQRRRQAVELAKDWARKNKARIYVDCGVTGPDYGSGGTRILILRRGIINNIAWYVADDTDEPLVVRRWSGESQEFWQQARDWASRHPPQ
jgi:hypothetical protein